MKRTLISLLCFLAVNITFAQQDFMSESADVTESVNISLEEINQVFVPAAIPVMNLKSAEGLKTFNVTFENVPETAKTAINHALTIWEQQISSPVAINVTIKWDNLPESQLGNGKPGIFYRNFKGTPVANVFYPVALVEKILSKDYNNPGDADIICTFNKNKAWYFGTNGSTPADKYDLVTAVLHEIGHGLGISGFFTTIDGVAQYNNSSNSPAVYDYFLFNENNQRIADKANFACPSSELTQQLTSNSLYLTKSAEQHTVPVYAPSSWISGVSIYHLKSTENSAEFMKAYAYKGEAIHNITEKMIAVLSGIGWNNAETENVTANEEIFNSSKINVYPNPCSSTLTFDYSDAGNQSSVEIRITDLMGRTVYSESNCDFQYNPSYKVDLSAVQAGIYLASVTDSYNNTFTKRIIKQ